MSVCVCVRCSDDSSNKIDTHRTKRDYCVTLCKKKTYASIAVRAHKSGEGESASEQESKTERGSK